MTFFPDGYFPPPDCRFAREEATATVNTFLGHLHGREIQMGDFRFIRRGLPPLSKGGDLRHGSPQVRYASYCAFVRLGTAFPALEIRHENLLDKLNPRQVALDIDFESDAFSRQFFVACSDPRFAHQVITPAMMEFLMQHPGFEINLTGDSLVVTRGESLWYVPDFDRALQFVRAFLALVPEFCWLDHSRPPTPASSPDPAPIHETSADPMSRVSAEPRTDLPRPALDGTRVDFSGSAAATGEKVEMAGIAALGAASLKNRSDSPAPGVYLEPPS